MYDRNGKLLVYNQPAYDVMLIMREIQPFDTLDFCDVLGITKEQFLKRIADIKNRRLNPRAGYRPIIYHYGRTSCLGKDIRSFSRKRYYPPKLYLKRIADIKNRRLNPGYSSYVPQVFMNQLSAQEYGVLQEKLYKFPGGYRKAVSHA